MEEIEYIGIFLLISSVLVSPYIYKITTLPTSIIEIIFGSLIVYFGLYTENHFVEVLAQFGFYYLMFLVGMEIKIGDIKNIKWLRVTLYLLILNILSVLIVVALNLNLFYLMIFPLMSVGMLKLIAKDTNKEWVSFAIITGIVGELISILILTVLEAYKKFGMTDKFYYNISSFFILLIFFAVFYMAVKKIFDIKPQWLKLLMPIRDSNSESFRIGFFVMIIMIGIMKLLEFEVALGAFVAGFFVVNFFTHKEDLLKHRFSSLGFGLFIPLFFINVGFQLDLTNLTNLVFLKEVFFVIFITLAIHFVSVLVFLNYLTKNEMFLFALSHSMPLTLLIVFSTIGTHMGIINNFENNVLITSAIIEVLISFSIIKSFLKREKV